MQALVFTIYNKNWEIFELVWNKCHWYLSGWYVFCAFRAFIECEWKFGLELFLHSESTFNILRAIPENNRKDLLSSMRQYSYVKAWKLDLDVIIDYGLDFVEEKIKIDEKRMIKE